MSSYAYFLYTKKNMVSSSVFAGTSAAFVGSGLAVSVFPTLAVIPPAAAAALIALGAAFTVALLHAIASSIVRHMKGPESEKAPEGRVNAQGTPSHASFWCYTDILSMVFAAASAASVAVLMPHWLLLAGASVPVVAVFAHPAMQLCFPALLWLTVKALGAGLTRLASCIQTKVADEAPGGDVSDGEARLDISSAKSTPEFEAADNPPVQASEGVTIIPAKPLPKSLFNCEYSEPNNPPLWGAQLLYSSLARSEPILCEEEGVSSPDTPRMVASC